ncbi:membrane protease YdiL (CAAX protease family) [Flavobacterium sp. 2755]|uniref:CPBP family intramembrane glutamic endopeptidase n=1 Tax=Flavobacterium sp. 2755 TaxID=2817765 RepID=UPI0028583775|nr:CPBP family intramembrane glutamic endopeptidase [Flavobacterium sp. 2755]MDR6764408.1 membrane protease YdiL (CAAX protease family) [Flavobacterium sp. 2755]
MLGIILLLLFYSIVLLIVEKRIYDRLGLIPTPKRLRYFCAGFLAAGLVVIINILIETSACSITWELKNPVRFYAIAGKAWLFFIAVFTEELFFRGIFFYLLLRFASEQYSVLISSACFGVYHWFSFGMINEPIAPLVYVFTITSLAGYCWSLAFLKSRTLLLPLGMHCGWNIINSLFNAQGSNSEVLFVKTYTMRTGDGANLFVSLVTGLLPAVLMYLYIRLKFSPKSGLQHA